MTVPMAVSDDEEDGGDADLRKVVVVNPFFAEKHLGPRATHPDGTLDTKAQLTSLWVLGDPTRPRREPRPLDPPGVVLRRPQLDPKMCGCLPTKCGPCHPGGPPESDLGSRRGTVSSWGDDSEAYARAGGSAARTAQRWLARAFRKAPSDRSERSTAGRRRRRRPGERQDSQGAAETRRPAPSRRAAGAPPPGCLSGCLQEEEWSEDEKGRRRRRKKADASRDAPARRTRSPGSARRGVVVAR